MEVEASSLSKLSPLEARLSKKLAGSAETRFAVLKNKTEKFRRHLELVQGQLVHILSEYQSYATSQDEFQRIFECLDSIDEMRGYFGRKTGSAAVFFPLNMPLYAMVLYGVFPALVTDRVYVRAPQRMTNLMRRLVPVLALDQYFPNINVVFSSREEFIDAYVSYADVIIFTGKLSNAQYVLKKTKKDSLFLFNGWGCNPIVVGENTDLEVAAAKAVEARLFSSGQDCAGPDTILVPRNSADTFVAMLKKSLANVKIGPYSDYANIVGPLSDDEQIRLIGSIFLKSSKDIVHGGVIDFPTSTIHPTIIVSDLNQGMNFEELFAPVLFVSTYEHPFQLKQYFEHPLYIANEMYVTLFGECDYIENLKRSIIVKDQVIFEVDRGNDEFGGYSMGASFVACNHKVTPKPVLVPRDIWDYLQPSSAGFKLSPSTQSKISKQTRKAMIDHFSSNLVFGFVFGSIARGEATGASDINSMVILETRDNHQIEQYTTWSRHLHEQHELKFRDQSSVVAITMNELNEMVTQLSCSPQVYDACSIKEPTLYIEALSGFQCGVGGDKHLCVDYGRRVRQYSKSFEDRRHQKHSKSASKGVEGHPKASTDKPDVAQSNTTSPTPLSPPLETTAQNDSGLKKSSEHEDRTPLQQGTKDDVKDAGNLERHEKSDRSGFRRLKQYIKRSKRSLMNRLRGARV